jgi:hypothetical protein
MVPSCSLPDWNEAVKGRRWSGTEDGNPQAVTTGELGSPRDVPGREFEDVQSRERANMSRTAQRPR